MIRSGLCGEEMPKDSKVRFIPFAILFPLVLTTPYHYRRFMYTYPLIRYSSQRVSWLTFGCYQVRKARSVR